MDRKERRGFTLGTKAMLMLTGMVLAAAAYILIRLAGG